MVAEIICSSGYQRVTFCIIILRADDVRRTIRGASFKLCYFLTSYWAMAELAITVIEVCWSWWMKRGAVRGDTSIQFSWLRLANANILRWQLLLGRPSLYSNSPSRNLAAFKGRLAKFLCRRITSRDYHYSRSACTIFGLH